VANTSGFLFICKNSCLYFTAPFFHKVAYQLAMFGLPIVARVPRFEELCCRLHAVRFHMHCTMYVFVEVQDFKTCLAPKSLVNFWRPALLKHGFWKNLFECKADSSAVSVRLNAVGNFRRNCCVLETQSSWSEIDG